jgi:xanthine dehydrogenase small subunit
VLVEHDGRTWFKPASIATAAEFKAQHRECAIISGGTDLGVQVNKGIRDPKTVMSLSSLDELRGICREGDTLVVGAAATIAEMELACADALPEYARLLYWFGSPPIKSAATIGGNIANGSPIGDSMPAMYVLNGEIELTGTTGARRVSINEFYTGYKTTVAAADELITRIFLPLPKSGELFKLYKVSKRKDLDISAFTAGLWMRLEGNSISESRLAFGGVGPNIIRLRQTEAFLSGQTMSLQTMRAAGRIARDEISPISDVRGSAEYRAQLAENVFAKFYFDLIDWRDSDGNGRFDGNGDQPGSRHPERSEGSRGWREPLDA